MFITHVSNLSSSTSRFRNIVPFFLRVCSGSHWTYQHPPMFYFWLLHSPDIPPDWEVQFHSVPSGLLQIFFCLVRCWPAWPISLNEFSIPESQTNGPLPPLSQDDANQQLLFRRNLDMMAIPIRWSPQLIKLAFKSSPFGAGFWDQTLLMMVILKLWLFELWWAMIFHTNFWNAWWIWKVPWLNHNLRGDMMKYFTRKEWKIVEVDSRWWN